MRKLLILCLGLLFTQQAFAQSGIHLTFGFQPQNVWQINRQDSDSGNFIYESTWKWAAGGLIGMNFQEPIGFRLGLFYSHDGQNSTQKILGAEFPATRELTHLKIPLLLHANSAVGPAMLIFEVGPQVNLLREAVVTFDGSNVDYGQPTENVFTNTTFSAAWALGVDIRLSDFMFFNLHHRGDVTLVDVEDKSAQYAGLIDVYPSERSITRGLTIGIMGGLTFVMRPGGGSGRKWQWIDR